MKLMGTQGITPQGHLEIGGIDAVDLAKKFGTPLYCMDQQLIEENCQKFKNSFKHDTIDTEVIYASKAFLTLAMCKLVEEQGLSLDVVSGGELFTAIRAGFPADKIYFHGNNKTLDEIVMALNYGVHRFIVDNPMELEILNGLCADLDKQANVLIRMNPGIEAHTHDFVQTANNDSKFGVSIYTEKLCDIIQDIDQMYYITLKGFHYHIGSQIFETKSYLKSLDVMMEFVEKAKRNCGYETVELNMGGGYGVYYAEGDDPMDMEESLKNTLEYVQKYAKKKNINLPKLLIEPGRAIVANAGTTLYKVGATKHTFGGKKFVFVDGGMTDNIRPALYDADYEGVIANKMNSEADVNYTVAGKCCESGDIVIKDILLPAGERGDILAVLSTGAYGYSMASNYNRIKKPAVVFIKDGKARVVVKRESYEDLIRNDIL